jgi:chromosome segregation ATPase
VQPLLKDWQRRRQEETPAGPEHVLSPELLKALSKQFSHDVQVALAELKDQLDASEEANGDLARENAALQARLRQREAELVALSDQDAVVRGQAAQLENDLAQLRSDYESERQARLACERQAAAASAQRDAVSNQLDELRMRFSQASKAATRGLAREQHLQEELATLRIAAGTTNARLDAALQNIARQETELAAARQAEQVALQVAAELRGQQRAGGL